MKSPGDPLPSLEQLDRLASLLDDRFRIPGTSRRIGIDPLIGLIPGVGDVAGAVFSAYIIWKAKRMGASRWVQFRMAANVLLETTVGAIPLVGDLFDAGYKANRRNLRLLRKDFQRRADRG